MNKDSFVKEIKRYTPSRDDFKGLGVSEGFIERELKKYDCFQREAPISNVFINSEVLHLVNWYDCSKLEIGVLRFSNIISETEDHYLIGEIEADVLAVNKITLEIEVLDYTDLNWVIWSCAQNGQMFLDAILLSAEYFSKMLTNDDLNQDTAFRHKYVLECAEKAGGGKYIEFYKLLLGYF